MKEFFKNKFISKIFIFRYYVTLFFNCKSYDIYIWSCRHCFLYAYYIKTFFPQTRTDPCVNTFINYD